MKILYVASTPQDRQSLLVERDITELQQKIGTRPNGQQVELEFLPELRIEDFGSAVSKAKATIIHFAAHGDVRHLEFKNSFNKTVPLNADRLAALLGIPNPPRLIYLSACNSIKIAEKLSKSVEFAIGTDAPVTNRSARASANLFYEHLMNGATVQQAFDHSRALLRAVSDDKTDSALFVRPDCCATQTRLMSPLNVIARLGFWNAKKLQFKRNFEAAKDGFFDLQVGVVDCPCDCNVAIFFTDDVSFKEFAVDESQGPPIRGVIWGDSNFRVMGDFRIGVSCLAGSGNIYSSFSTLCEALQKYHNLGGYGGLKAKQESKFNAALDTLLSAGGG
jgi:hypothetical protein